MTTRPTTDGDTRYENLRLVVHRSAAGWHDFDQRIYEQAVDELDELRTRISEQEVELERADDLLRRLSEWDVLYPGPNSGDAAYWQAEIAEGSQRTHSNPPRIRARGRDVSS